MSKYNGFTLRVGDIVCGIEGKTVYSITNASMTKGLVLKVLKNSDKKNPGNKDIIVKVLEHKSGNYIGQTFPVCSIYFKKIGHTYEQIQF